MVIFASSKYRLVKMSRNTSLNYTKIIITIERLEKRIEDRFPESGLKKVISDFFGDCPKQQKKYRMDIET